MSSRSGNRASVISLHRHRPGATKRAILFHKNYFRSSRALEVVLEGLLLEGNLIHRLGLRFWDEPVELVPCGNSPDVAYRESDR
ncbi:hypothetical protein RHRU231_940006 [Rhodococcus ruber]|uniref:Uncharacterized protein n=1 Tax=Rhodococcus ruber TaxID=1830 RepID=A0A098BUF6_9NOCA|nr:hypothetical protein RHRU231_940006 [Rhodococcus ruber]